MPRSCDDRSGRGHGPFGAETDVSIAVARKAGCSDDVAFVTLSKTDAADNLPRLPDIEARLAATLTSVWARDVRMGRNYMTAAMSTWRGRVLPHL